MVSESHTVNSWDTLDKQQVSSMSFWKIISPWVLLAADEAKSDSFPQIKSHVTKCISFAVVSANPWCSTVRWSWPCSPIAKSAPALIGSHAQVYQVGISEWDNQPLLFITVLMLLFWFVSVEFGWQNRLKLDILTFVNVLQVDFNYPRQMKPRALTMHTTTCNMLMADEAKRHLNFLSQCGNGSGLFE